MGGKNHLRVSGQRPFIGLCLKSIEPGTCYCPLIQRFHKCAFVHQSAASCVEQKGPWFYLGELFTSNELGFPAGMNGNNIGLWQGFLKGGLFHTFNLMAANERVYSQDFRMKRAQKSGDTPTNTTKTDDRNRFSRKLRANSLAPFSTMQVPVHLGNHSEQA